MAALCVRATMRASRIILLLVAALAMTSCHSPTLLEQSTHVLEAEAVLSFGSPTNDLRGLPVRLVSISRNGSTKIEVLYQEKTLRLVAKPGAYYPIGDGSETLQLLAASFETGTARLRRRAALGNW